jgi:hypothetical protein
MSTVSASTIKFPSLLLILFLSISLTSPITAQLEEEPLRCGIEQWMEIQKQNPQFAEQFRQTEAYIRTQGHQRSPDCSNPIILPIAIHWNGNVENVPCLMDMVENQLQVINEDFGAYNPDISNYCDHSLNCPDEYAPDAISGGTCIQFCLATQNHPAGSGLSDGDPAFTFGEYTFNTGAPEWAGYVNVFVSDVPPPPYGSNLLGLAPLAGGANPNGNGVWVNANCFGGFEETCVSGSVVINSYGNYDLGRTLTHELGHYYGLYHTFAGCFPGDQIDDTPAQSQSNSGIPTIGPDCISTAHNTCGTQDFFFNYMDYTYDEGMYMFTSGQSDLMYDVALDGSYQSETTVCSDLPNDYFPLFPAGCYTCPDLSIDATVTDNPCYQDCAGSIVINNVNQGTAPFDYEWSNGETTPAIDNLCSGSYSVTITDNFGCEVIENFFVDEPTELFANSSSTDETGNDFEDGTATANPSGGTSPYFYSWSNGEITQDIDHLAPGSYTVTVSDFNGCESIESVFVEEFICPTLSVDSNHGDIFCAGECNGFASINDVINAEPPLQYIWNNGEETAFIGDLCEGAYVVTITDLVNCSITPDTFYIIEPTELLISTTSTDETGMDLNDGTATVIPDGGVPPYTYQWSNGGTTQTIANLAPGLYTVTVTDFNDCNKEDQATVEEYLCQPMTVESYFEAPGCFESCDGFIEINAVTGGEPPYMFEWSNGANTEINNGLCAGEYTVTITDALECTLMANFTIEQPEAFMAMVESTDETAYQASDGTASASPSGGLFPFEYQWSNGDTGGEIFGLAPGEYTVTITDANGCETSNSVIILEFICPALAIESETLGALCFNDCSGSINLTGIVNGTPPYHYNWSNGDTGSAAENLCAGEYAVTVTDGYNCPVSASFNITEPDSIVLSLNATGETANMSNDGTASCLVTGGTTPYTYLWNNGADTSYISSLAPGTYSVTITDGNGCTETGEVQVTAYGCPQMVINANATSIVCFGDCDGEIEITGVENGTAPFSYSWSTGETIPKLQNLCSGTYEVSITDDQNCTISKSFTIEEGAEIIITIDTVADFTSNGTGFIEISADREYEYSWTKDDGFYSNGQDIYNLESGCYKLIITDPSSGCTVDTTVCVDDLTAIINTWEDEIWMFPNPANEKLIIDFGKLENKTISLFISDWSGSMLKNIEKKTGEKDKVINTGDLPAGVYLLRIRHEGQSLNRKVIVVH